MLAAAALATVVPGASAAGGSRLLIETCFQPPFGDPHSEFHTVRPDGRDLRRVRRFPTLGPTDCAHRYPNWSPDGRRVAYMSGDAIAVGPAGWRRAWRRDRIVAPIGMWPAWSPDGRRLTFIRREADVVNSLSVVSAAGGRVRRLVRTNDSLEWPSWSADGRQVLYSTNMVSQPGQIQMWRVSAAGGRPRPLGRGRSADMAPDGPREPGANSRAGRPRAARGGPAAPHRHAALRALGEVGCRAWTKRPSTCRCGASSRSSA